MHPDHDNDDDDKLKILVIDDHRSDRESLVELLTIHDYQVAGAAGGREALQYLEQNSVDLALVDLVMPGMDGIELLREIKNRWPSLEVILISAYATLEKAITGLQAGSGDFLPKTCSIDTVIAAAERVRSKKSMQQSVRTSEANYRVLFNSSPGVIMIGDFSRIKEYLNRLPREATTDYTAFFQAHPQEVTACLSLLRITEVNRAALRLFGAASQQKFIDHLFRVIGPRTRPFTIGIFEAIGEGRTFYESEIILYHITSTSGREIYGIIRWNVVSECNSYQRVILAFTDISARKKAEDDLTTKKAELQRLSRHLIEVEEAHRKHIARELHDKLGQQLTALGINLNILRASGRLAADPPLAGRIADSLALLEGMTEQTRDIMAELRPPVLDDYGLGAALRWYGSIFARRTGIRVAISAPDEGSRLPSALELALFRIVQEAMTNTAKHAEASELWVHCRLTGHDLTLTVSDNGRGFTVPAETRQAGIGFVSMRERMQAFGGSLQVNTPPPKGGGFR